MAQEAPTTSGEASRLVVCAVGSKSDIKKWPAENYAELLDRLAVNQKARIVLIGDQNDAADAAKVKSLMSMPAMNLAGRTNFQELCAALKTADLLITNDSAPLHVADALGVPILAIFGPTDSKKYGPRSFGSQAVHRTLFCSPCEKAQCRFRHECMKELGVSEVYRRAAQILYDEMTPRAPRILAIRLDRIGDLVLSFPALSAIKERFPESTLSVMTRASTQSIAENHPAVDEVIPYFYEKGGRHRFIKGNIRFIHEIIRRRFDIVFILNPSVRSYLVPFVARIPYRVGFQVPVPFLLTHSVPDHRHQGKKHESEYTLDAVRAFGIKPSGSPYPVWPVSLYDLLKIAARLKNISCLPDALPRGGVSGCAEELLTPPRGTASIDPIIAIHAGSSCPSKRWPKEKFAELGTRMIQEGYRVAVIGGSNERTLGEYLKRAIGENVLDLTGELELPELAAFLKRCTALVSNDSGPVHIAAAVGTPVLSIFGRTQSGLSPVRWRPLGRETAVIQKNVGCVVCLAHRCTIEFECLKALAVEEVSRALQMILKKYQNEIQRS
jgi:lipopolysaccharide heptosyltransferase II